MSEQVALRASFDVRIPGFNLRIDLVAGPELVVVFGPSGSGKSVALKTLSGLHRPERGKITLNGRVLFDGSMGIDLPPQSREVGYVPQNYALFPHRTISENIAYGLHKVKKQERVARVSELLISMRLEDFADRLPSEVSGGQQQRAALARALAPKPGLLLMDEPFAALEEELRVHLREELLRVQRTYQIPMVLVTHNLEEAYFLADQLVVLHEGRVVQAAARDDVFRKPATPAVAQLMGMTNILEAKVIGMQDDLLRLTWGGIQLQAISNRSMEPGEVVQLGLRPEEVIFIRQDRPLEPSLERNLLSGVIVKDRARGYDHLVNIEVDSPQDGVQILTARIPHPLYRRLGLAIGENRKLSIKPGSLHVFPA